jgi:CHASE2 domain-containing sensor protein
VIETPGPVYGDIPEKRKWTRKELAGLSLIMALLLVMMISPGTLALLFNAIVDKVFRLLWKYF